MHKNLVLAVVLVAAAVLAAVLYSALGGSDSGARHDAAPAGAASAGGAPAAAALAGGETVAPGSVEQPAPSRDGRELIAAEPERPEASARANTGSVELVGRLVDKLGAPVGGARVELGGGFGFGFLDREPAPHGATSAPDGGFRITGVRSGTQRLSARAEGFAPLERYEIAVPDVVRHDAGEIVMVQGARLLGRVVDASGRAVAGAELRTADSNRIFAGPFANRGPLLATSAPDGVFEVAELAVGPWRILVTSADHPDKTFEGETTRPGELARGLTFELPPGAEIDGVVYGVPSTAQSTVSVRASGISAGDAEFFVNSFRSQREAAVDAGGRFTLRGLVPDQAYSVQLREKPGAPGREFWQLGPRSAPVNAKAGDRGVELRWQEEGVATLRVVDARTKAPVTRMRVDAGVAFPVPLTGPDGEVQREFEDGFVRVGNLYPRMGSSTLRVEIRAAGYADRELEGHEIAAGQALDLGVVELQPVPTAVVHVVDAASGAPVEGAEVTLARQNRPGPRGGPGEFVESLEIRIGDGDAPEFIESGRPTRRGRTDETGVATLSALEGETCVLTVAKSGFAEARVEPVECPSGQSIEETVRLTMGGTVEVLVRGADGEILPGEKVRRGESGGRGRGRRFFGPRGTGGELERVTDSEGVARFEHLAAGTHEFSLDEGRALGGDAPFIVMQGGGDERDEQPKIEVSVLEGSLQRVELRASPRGDLTGTIREAGRPLAGATLRIAAAPEGREDDRGGPFRAMMFAESMAAGAGGGTSARTDGEGAYSFGAVKTGRYELTVTHAGRQMPARAYVVVDEGGTRFDLDLSLSIVSGRVVDQDGEPVAGAQVWAEEAPDEQGADLRSFFAFAAIDAGDEVFSFGSGAGTRVRSDADGRYELRGVEPDVDLVVKSTHELMQPAQSERFRLVHNETKSGLEVQAEVGASVEVAVTGPDGNPAGMCMAEAEQVLPPGSPDRPDSVQQFVGPGGKARLNGLKPGTWTVRITRLGPENESGGPEPQTIELEPRENGQLAFTLD